MKSRKRGSLFEKEEKIVDRGTTIVPISQENDKGIEKKEALNIQIVKARFSVFASLSNALSVLLLLALVFTVPFRLVC